jgi:tetratricopeptide (TPR) repeat protein
MGGFSLDLSVNHFNVARSFEAATWEAFTKQEWASSTSSAISWLKDQPFSSRPAVIASHLSAAVLEDYDAAERLAKFGQIANPNENLLHINLAFSYASSDRTSEALDELNKVKGNTSNPINIALLANLGLIAFREKKITEGRYYYGMSVDLSESLSDKTNKAAALTYWAREEVHARSAAAQDVLARAAEAVKQISSVEAPFVLARIEERYKQQREKSDKK